MDRPETPVSTKLMEEFNKLNKQYLEGAITANEAVCKMHSLIFNFQVEIGNEYEAEQKALKNIKIG